MDCKQALQEDLLIALGVGVTYTVGSDSYAYYVSECLPNGVIGLYSPKVWFDGSWVDGCQQVAAFDSSHPSEFYAKRRYGNWWKVEKDGTPIGRWTGKWSRIHFGQAYSYRDPSF